MLHPPSERLLRRRNRKGIIVTIAALVMTTSSVVAAPNAQAKAGDLVIYNSSSSTNYLLVCKDWTGTKCSGNTWYGLNPGKNTKTAFGWADADAVQLTSENKYYVSTDNWTVHNSCGGAVVYEKRPGSALGNPAVETWTVYKC